MDDELHAIRERRVRELSQTAASARAGRARPLEVNEDTLGAFLENHPLAVVDVWASWCGPCRMMEPLMEELAVELSGRVGVAKLNADENPDFLMAHGIQGIPTFLWFKDGQMVGSLVGARPKRDFHAVADQLAGKDSGDPSVQ